MSRHSVYYGLCHDTLQWCHNERDDVLKHQRLIVCTAVCSGADQRKHQSSASLAFVRGIHRRPVISPHKGPVTRKTFPFDDVIMRTSSRHQQLWYWPSTCENIRSQCIKSPPSYIREAFSNYGTDIQLLGMQMTAQDTPLILSTIFGRVSQMVPYETISRNKSTCSQFCPAFNHQLQAVGDNVGDGCSLQWHHHELYGVSDHQSHDCLFNCLFKRKSKKTPKLCVIALCARNSPVTGELPTQKASNAENVSIWWRHHIVTATKVNSFFGCVTQLLNGRFI